MEIWKDIKDYEGLYQVSNIGRVRRLKGYYCKNDKIIKSRYDKDGYLQICLSKNNKTKFFRVHRLVACAFIDNLENKLYINHINGIKDDNRVENIEWCTASENQKHCIRTGLKKEYFKNGSEHRNSKLNELQVKIIKYLLKKSNLSQTVIASFFNVSIGTISSIKNNKTWKHVIYNS